MDLWSSKFFLIWFDAEQNLKISLPGFASDEIKSYRKPVRPSLKLALLLSLCCVAWEYCFLMMMSLIDDSPNVYPQIVKFSDLIGDNFAAC